MNLNLEEIIKEKLELLIDFVIEKNQNASKDVIYRKIYHLNILNENGPFVPIIQVRKSKYSNYILVPSSNHHLLNDLIENKLVININTKTIIGIENSTGEIEPLNKQLLKMCNKYKLKAEIPLNLNEASDDVSDVIKGELSELGLCYEAGETNEDEDEE